MFLVLPPRGRYVDGWANRREESQASLTLHFLAQTQAQLQHGIAMSLTTNKAVPLLRVADVAQTMEWYRQMLGFEGDPFPAEPPHAFAILRRGHAEIMVRRGSPAPRPNGRQYDWDVYLRLDGTGFGELYSQLSAAGVVTRRMERMFYGLAEFEITDLDGCVICLSHPFHEATDLPTPAV